MNLDELIHLDDSNIDKAALLHQIEQNLAQHALDAAVSFPTFVAETPAPDRSKTLSVDLLQTLAQLNEEASQLWLDPQLPPATSAVGRLLNWIKRPFHQLVLFYVNKMGEQQNDINDQMRRLISQLIAELNQPAPPADS